ncbi:MAG: hypothetical protein M4D85_00060 [Actinomycetota bacterium]|nr:hypothetical protein [Actinomycetota bacterium]
MLARRPCRSREGRAPRAAIALLLTAAAAVWVGSFALVVSAVSGHAGDTLRACGVLWRQLLAGDLSWWGNVLLAAWLLMLPGRGLASAMACLHRSGRLLRDLRTASIPGPGDALPNEKSVLVVPGLSTPAITLGVVRPTVLTDATFWETATTTQRAVVLAHEQAHRRGRHGLLDAVARMLTAPLAPLPLAAGTYDCVRRHLEALADDAAARRYGSHHVGLALGRVALAASPGTGLGAAGAALWRVHRLVMPSSPSWPDRILLGAVLAGLVLGLLVVADDTVHALGPVVNAQFCPV